MLFSRLIGTFSLATLLLAGCASTTTQQPATPETPSAALPLTRTAYSDDGASELSMPDSWTVRPDFATDATLRVAEESGQAYLLVNSYFPGEIEEMPLQSFGENYVNNLAMQLSNASIGATQSLTINGMEAHRYLVTGDIGAGRLTYVTTVIDGKRARHHAIGWVAANEYTGQAHVLNQIANSFRESESLRPAKQRVTLNFAWPGNLSSISAVHRKIAKQGNKSEIKARFRTTVRPDGNNDLIISTNVASIKLIGGQEAQSDYMKNLLQQISTEIPDYVVNTEGEFVRVDNLSAYQKRIEKAIFSFLPDDAKGRKDEIMELIRPNLSEQFLAASITDDWNKTVGGWVNSSYVPGETYPFKEIYYAPSLGKTPFNMAVSRQVTGFAPCTAGESRCVKLLHTATVSGEDFRAAMARFLEGVVNQPINVKNVSVVRKMEIIAEPDTLIPHRTRSIEETIVVIEDKNGKANTSREIKDTRTTYSYESKNASR